MALQLHTGGAVAITLDQLLNGIAWEESRGQPNNGYGADNGIAVGKYQVLKSNVPEWSREALGYSISWQTFLNSPSLQDQVVRYKLGRMFNSYGAEGAAAMWFSGSPNPNSSISDGNTTVREYVNNVIAHSGGGGSYTPYDSGGGGTVVPQLSMEELAAQYGFTMSFLNANPELRDKIFKPMVAEGWSKDMFDAKLHGTKWWRTHSDKERQYLTMLYTDPATARQNFSQAKVQVQQLAAQLGIDVTPYTQKQLDAAAYNLVAKGWSEGQLRNFLGQYVFFGTAGAGKGQGEDVQHELRNYAYSMGIQLSDSWYANNARQVVRGLGSVTDFKSQILNQAKAAFPQYGKQLDGGQTVADIAAPYMQSMSQILELPQGSINLFDPTIKKALQYKNPITLQGEAKPLWQFENDLRSDPRWKQTKNAQDSMMQVAHQVLSDFGFRH